MDKKDIYTNQEKDSANFENLSYLAKEICFDALISTSRTDIFELVESTLANLQDELGALTLEQQEIRILKASKSYSFVLKGYEDEELISKINLKLRTLLN